MHFGLPKRDMYMYKALVPLLLISLSGCASITGEKVQPVAVQTLLDNKEIAGIGCTLTNDEGRWFVTTPGTVTVRKSTADLLVECRKDANIVGNETLVSRGNGSVWGNVLLGGGIGYVIDRNTGAGFDYPSSSSIILRRIESVVREGLTEVKEKLSSNTGPSPTITQKLRDLQELRKDGVITEADFEKKKQLLLEGM